MTTRLCRVCNEFEGTIEQWISLVYEEGYPVPREEKEYLGKVCKRCLDQLILVSRSPARWDAFVKSIQEGIAAEKEKKSK
jgi:hypothetical protein